MQKNKSRWILPIVFNIVFILPLLRVINSLLRVIRFDVFGLAYFGLQFIVCFVLLILRKSDAIFFFLGLLIAWGLVGLLILIENNTIFEPLTVFRYDRWAGVLIYFLIFFSFIAQAAAVLLSQLVQSIKNKRNIMVGPDVGQSAESAAAAGKPVRSEGMKLFLALFITVFLATLLIHFLPDLIYISAGDTYADSHYISDSNVDEFSGSDMWAGVLDRSDEFGIKRVKTSCRKDGADHSGEYRAEIVLKNLKKEDLISKSKEIMSFISDHLSDDPDCEINKFNSITFRFSAGRDHIDISDQWQNEKLDGFDSVIIYNDGHYNDENGPQLSDLTEFDGYRYIMATVPLDLESDLSVLKQMENTESIVLRINANERNTKKLEQKAADLGLDDKVSFS